MLGWVADVERATLDNTNFRTVLFTGEHTQLTVMRIEAGDDIGLETHEDHDQFIRIEEGQARVELGPTEDQIEETHEVKRTGRSSSPRASGTTSSTRGTAT